MGATTQKKIRVAFAYTLTAYTGEEFTLAVIANVYPGRQDHTYPRDMQTGQDEETTAEIVQAVWHPNAYCSTPKLWENIPAAIAADIEAAAIERATE